MLYYNNIHYNYTTLYPRFPFLPLKNWEFGKKQQQNSAYLLTPTSVDRWDCKNALPSCKLYVSQIPKTGGIYRRFLNIFPQIAKEYIARNLRFSVWFYFANLRWIHRERWLFDGIRFVDSRDLHINLDAIIYSNQFIFPTSSWLNVIFH